MMRFLVAERQALGALRFAVWLDTDRTQQDGQPDPAWVFETGFPPPAEREDPDAYAADCAETVKREARERRRLLLVQPGPLAMQGESFEP